jgi:hypothetical protein
MALNTNESWKLDVFNLNTGFFELREVVNDPPAAKGEFIGAADSEMQILIRQPLHENRKITMKVTVKAQASMDAALDALQHLVITLRGASGVQGGIPLVWQPAGSTRTVTFDVLLGQITGLPISLTDADGITWLMGRPTVTLEMECAPYFRYPWQVNITDTFAFNTIANGDYTFDAGGAANVAAGTGFLDAVLNLATENRLLHTASPYELSNARVSMKHTLGTTLASYKAGVILKRSDALNYIEAYVDDTGAASRLRVDQITAGVRTNLTSTALTRMTVSTNYWIRARLEGSTVYAEHWTAAPSVTGTATASNIATTTTTSGSRGRFGIVWTPQQTAATLTDFLIEPNVFISSSPLVTGEVVNFTGDVPALGIIIVTDGANWSRRHVEWGLEASSTYNSSTSLLIDSDDMVVSGFSGAQATTTGAYDPNASGNNSILVSPLVASATTALGGTGNLSHVGVFRLKARVQSGSLSNKFRVSWRAADGPMNHNNWVLPVSLTGWQELDLDTITIPAVVAGQQRWTGQLEVQGAATTPGTAVSDYLLLIPQTGGYGKARAVAGADTGVVAQADSFVQTAGALNGKTLSNGGQAWVTSGGATEFQVTGTGAVTRKAFDTNWGGRYAIAGTTNYTDCSVHIEGSGFSDYATESPFSEDNRVFAVMIRWVDANNWFAVASSKQSSPTVNVNGYRAIKRVGGTISVVQTADILHYGQSAVPGGVAETLDISAYSDGTFAGTLQIFHSSVGDRTYTFAGQDSDLATGGPLASGKTGFYTEETLGSTQTDTYTFDNFYVISLPVKPPAMYGGRSIQFRYDDTLREDSSGTYYGQPPSYRGRRCLIPTGINRAVVKARRNDVETTVDDAVTDTTMVQVLLAPRGLVIPAVR